MPREFRSFEQFWPHYLREHADLLTRYLHILGTVAAILCVSVFGLTGDARWLLAAIIPAYGFAWMGHALEGNSPAAFSHPLWSLRADLRMYWLWLTGGLEPELRKAGVAHSSD